MRKQPHTDPPDHHLRARALVGEMTEDERLWCLDGDAPFWAGLAYLGESGYHKSPFRSGRIDRLGLEGFAFSDGPRGVVIDQATCFPVSIARGATWDPDFEERIGEAIGTELRAVGADLYGGVCVNVLRHPAWGRAQETYGEDPYHVGMMGAALTRGVQRHTMACVKHLACNSMENARFTVDVTVDEVVLHEVYLPHFKRIVDEGVAAVMTAYNSVNGAWCGQNRTLITDILREEWGFDGFVISDWILGLRQAAESVRAGLDVEMPYRMVRARDLAGALGTGELAWSEVDAAAERVVATRLRFEDVLDQPRPDRHVLSCAAHRGLAREAASRSLVLLRNEPVDGHPVLPLDPVGAGTAVLLGALATQVNLGDGGSSDVWAPDVVTVADGMTASLGQRLLGVDDSGDPVSSAALASGPTPPSSSSATPDMTKGSSSARPGARTSERSSPARTTQTSSIASKRPSPPNGPSNHHPTWPPETTLVDFRWGATAAPSGCTTPTSPCSGPSPPQTPGRWPSWWRAAR